MRVSDLYREVAQLGFEDSLESGDRFLSAANRALLQVAAIRPREGVLALSHTCPCNLLSLGDGVILHEGGTELAFEATGARAFYFECDGNGTATIEREVGGMFVPIGTLPLSAAGGVFAPYRGLVRSEGSFVQGRVRLRFTGEFDYSVRALAMYRTLRSDNKEDIPSPGGTHIRYDIGLLAPDFLALCTPAVLENVAYDVENGCVLLLPREESGVYHVRYQKMPTKISVEDDPDANNAEIDLDSDLCALLPLLIAAYVWLEDEPSMAQYYLSLYRERAEELQRRCAAPMRTTFFKNVTGW